MSQEVYSGQLTTGRTVLWYHSAKPDAKPVPALVSAGYGGGVADLIVMFPDTGATMKRSVYHMSSPSLRFPETGLLTENATVHGGWDFCEHDPEKPAKAERSTAKK